MTCARCKERREKMVATAKSALHAVAIRLPGRKPNKKDITTQASLKKNP